MAAKKSAGKASKTTRKATRKATRATSGKTAKVKTVSRSVTTPIKDPLTKSAIVRTIAETVGLKNSDVNRVMEEMAILVERHIGPKSTAGSFTIPGLLKIVRIYKAAKKARKGINPFTGEETMFKAKPAHYVVKIRALKKLKDMVGKAK